MKKKWNPGGQKGKLHRELGIPVGQKIPAARLAAATRSKNSTVRRDAIRARTMSKWGKEMMKGKPMAKGYESTAKDKAMDKKRGIKEGSRKDIAMDKKLDKPGKKKVR